MYEFDGGSQAALFTEVARGYIALLEPLQLADDSPPSPRGPYLETLKQLPWLPDDRYLGERASELLGILPAIYVVVTGANVTARAQEAIDWNISVQLCIASGWAGQLVEGRLNAHVDDPRQDPGVFVIMQHAIEYLHHRELATSPTSGPIRVTETAHVATDPAVTMWSIATEVAVRQAVQSNRDAPPLDLIQANHSITGPDVTVTQRRKLL